MTSTGEEYDDMKEPLNFDDTIKDLSATMDRNNESLNKLMNSDREWWYVFLPTSRVVYLEGQITLSSPAHTHITSSLVVVTHFVQFGSELLRRFQRKEHHFKGYFGQNTVK